MSQVPMTSLMQFHCLAAENIAPYLAPNLLPAICNANLSSHDGYFHSAGVIFPLFST